jgi:ubiquinone/menaquinone biosynthesis C-methylase UbiE
MMASGEYMPMRTIYSGASEERVTGTDFLEKRLEINKSYASADFDAWLFERLKVKAGEDILDVGCGSGAQTVPFSRLVSPGGSVMALDLSADSVALLKTRVGPQASVEAVAADMASLATLIRDQFRVKRYDLVHSSYALYYSPERMHVLDTMRAALKRGGRCAVFTPNSPHGLVELAARFTKVPETVYDSLAFGANVLKPYFDSSFQRVEVHHFDNLISLPSAELVLEFYRQTTYYNQQAETPMRDFVQAAIAKTGAFQYEKHGYLIIGYT